jgi:hypothetical protein
MKLALAFPPLSMAEFPMLISGSSSIAASLGASALSRLDRLMAPKTEEPGAGMTTAPTKTAKDEFLDYAKMTPAQKMRASMLSKLGVTEEQLKAMDSKERQKIEDKIKEMIKAEIEGPDGDRKPKGMLVDVKA